MLTHTIIVDSDALIALFNKDDANAKKASKLFTIFLEKKIRLLYPATTLVETIDTLQRKLKKHEEALRITQLIAEARFATESVVAINGSDIKEALMFFGQKSSNHTTLADAIVAYIAKKYEARAICSFDTWYKKVGFRLAVDIY